MRFSARSGTIRPPLLVAAYVVGVVGLMTWVVVDGWVGVAPNPEPKAPREWVSVTPKAKPRVEVPANLSISGHVRFPSGLPVPGIEVCTPLGRTHTDAAGAFTLTGFDAGRVTLMVPAMHAKFPVQAGDADVEYVLRSSWLLVHARDENGFGLFGVDYSVDVGSLVRRGWVEARTYWGVPIQSAQTASVVVRHPGNVAGRIFFTPVAIEPRLYEFTTYLRPAPETALLIDVKNHGRARFIRAEVLGFDGALLREERLPLRAGGALLRGLPVGRVRVRVYTESCEASQTRSLAIRLGSVTRAKFVMPPAGVLHVHWKGRAGSRLVLERVDGTPLETWFLPDRGSDRWTTASRVAFGTYVVVEIRRAERGHEQTVDITRERGTAVRLPGRE